jgi:hypothetical protein
MAIAVDDFAFSHWDNPDYSGAKITNMSKGDFLELVRNHISENGGFDKVPLKDMLHSAAIFSFQIQQM